MAPGGYWRALRGRLRGLVGVQKRLRCLFCGSEVERQLEIGKMPGYGWWKCMVCGFLWVCDEDGEVEYDVGRLKGVRGFVPFIPPVGCLVVVESRDVER